MPVQQTSGSPHSSGRCARSVLRSIRIRSCSRTRRVISSLRDGSCRNCLRVDGVLPSRFSSVMLTRVLQHSGRSRSGLKPPAQETLHKGHYLLSPSGCVPFLEQDAGISSVPTLLRHTLTASATVGCQASFMHIGHQAEDGA